MVLPALITLATHRTSVLQGLRNLMLKSVVATFASEPITVRIAQQVTVSAIVPSKPPWNVS